MLTALRPRSSFSTTDNFKMLHLKAAMLSTILFQLLLLLLPSSHGAIIPVTAITSAATAAGTITPGFPPLPLSTLAVDDVDNASYLVSAGVPSVPSDVPSVSVPAVNAWVMPSKESACTRTSASWPVSPSSHHNVACKGPGCPKPKSLPTVTANVLSFCPGHKQSLPTARPHAPAGESEEDIDWTQVHGSEEAEHVHSPAPAPAHGHEHGPRHERSEHKSGKDAVIGAINIMVHGYIIEVPYSKDFQGAFQDGQTFVPSPAPASHGDHDARPSHTKRDVSPPTMRSIPDAAMIHALQEVASVLGWPRKTNEKRDPGALGPSGRLSVYLAESFGIPAWKQETLRELLGALLPHLFLGVDSSGRAFTLTEILTGLRGKFAALIESDLATQDTIDDWIADFVDKTLNGEYTIDTARAHLESGDIEIPDITSTIPAPSQVSASTGPVATAPSHNKRGQLLERDEGSALSTILGMFFLGVDSYGEGLTIMDLFDAYAPLKESGQMTDKEVTKRVAEIVQRIKSGELSIDQARDAIKPDPNDEDRSEPELAEPELRDNSTATVLPGIERRDENVQAPVSKKWSFCWFFHWPWNWPEKCP